VEGKNIDWNSPEKKAETKESLLNSDPVKIYTGFKEIRLETEEEMLKRGGETPVQREFPIYRTETKEERDIRIASEITKLNL